MPRRSTVGSLAKAGAARPTLKIRLVAINEANATAVDGRDCISFGEVVLSAVDTIRAADARDASVGSKPLAVKKDGSHRAHLLVGFGSLRPVHANRWIETD